MGAPYWQASYWATGYWHASYWPSQVPRAYWHLDYWAASYWHTDYWASTTTLAVAFDVAAASLRPGGGTTEHTWTHPSAIAPRGVVIAALHGVTAGDHISAVTYGTVPLTRVVRATDTTVEPGAAEFWFRGQTLPPGPQTVRVTCAPTTDPIRFVSMTFSGGANTEVLDVDSISQDAANPQRTLTVNGRASLAICAIYSGLPNVTDLAPLADMTPVDSYDAGAFVMRVDRQTSPGTTNPTLGYTAAFDDVAFVSLVLAAVLPSGAAMDASSTLSVATSATLTAGIALSASVTLGVTAAPATLDTSIVLTGSLLIETTAVGQIVEGAGQFFRPTYWHTDYWHTDYWAVTSEAPVTQRGVASLFAYWLGGGGWVGTLRSLARLTLTTSGDLSTAPAFASNVVLRVTGAGTLTTGIRVEAPATLFRVLTSGALTTAINLTGTSTLRALSTVADLTGGSEPPSGASSLTLTASGTLTTEILLTGALTLRLEAITGSLLTSVPLRGDADLRLHQASTLTTAIRLAATPITLRITTTSDLTGGSVPLYASVTLRITGTGPLTTGVGLTGTATMVVTLTGLATDAIPPPDGQIRSGLARIVEGSPSLIDLDGITIEEAGLLEAGQLFKFQRETMLWYPIRSVVQNWPPARIELAADYHGTIPTGVLSSYCVHRNFTDTHGLPELFEGDIDIRDVYTLTMRKLDGLVNSGGIMLTGQATVTAGLLTWTVTGTFPVTYKVLVTPTWLTSTLVRDRSRTQFVIDFADVAPADAEVNWAVLA